MSFYNRVDPVLIERLLPAGVGEEQSGVYAQAFRLLEAGQNFAYLFAVLLLPLFSKMIKEKHVIDHLVKLSFSLIITGALIISITSSFFGEQLMLLMYTPFELETTAEYMHRIGESARIFKLLMYSFVAISATYVFGTLLTANNNLKQLNSIATIGLLTNLVLNFILIPHFLAYGSAIASLSAQSITALLQMGFAYHILKLKIDFKLLLGMAITVVSLIVSGYILTNLIVVEWWISVLIMGLFGLTVAFAFKLINLGELFTILKTEKL
jgi:O-antigen/teichoic acid export membrane protein